MLEHCSDYPRFAILTIRQKVDKKGGSDESAEEYIDVIIGILASQGHSSIKVHPHMFGWIRFHWNECPVLFRQTNASNHDRILAEGLYPGGPDRYYGRGGAGGHAYKECR